MTNQAGTYDSALAKELTLAKLLDIFARQNVTGVYVKKLAPNDNSKNQPYFGGHLTDLSFIPSGDLIASESTSQKSRITNRDIKYSAPLSFSWVDASGELYPAPNSKLIYYPQYPEVRFSGFLKGSRVSAGEWMDPTKNGRREGRWLILGVRQDKKIFGYLATPNCNLSKELESLELDSASAVFKIVPLSKGAPREVSSRSRLISKFLEIHNAGWIPSQRLTADRGIIAYEARNAGGYTLEAQLEITPNGYAEPDYLGWEVKQFSVTRFPRIGARPTTLFTPEPDGGLYKDQGAISFVRQYGYEDKSGKPDRLNFGGKHIVDQVQATTGLKMKLLGFDAESGRITEAAGCIALIDQSETITASWSFAKLMDHWKRKHAKALYVPSMLQKREDGRTYYRYGNEIELGAGTDMELLLKRLQDGSAYYDPGIKLEQASSPTPKIKKRNQFRTTHKQLPKLYKSFEYVDISTPQNGYLFP